MLAGEGREGEEIREVREAAEIPGFKIVPAGGVLISNITEIFIFSGI